jgi:hypothetical protein
MTTWQLNEKRLSFFTKASGFTLVLSEILSLAAGLLGLYAAFAGTWCSRTTIGPNFSVTREFSLAEIATSVHDLSRFSISIYLIVFGAIMVSVAAILCMALWRNTGLRFWIQILMALGMVALIVAWLVGGPTMADSYSGVQVLWSSGSAVKHCFSATMLASSATIFCGVARRTWPV